MQMLSDQQLQRYAISHAPSYKQEMFDALVSSVADHFGSAGFKHMDIGGGTGWFADMLLEQFPNCTSLIVDPANVLLEQNRPHDNKRLVCARVEEMDKYVQDERFDLITLNWVLHHLVLRSYAKTRAHMVDVLRRLRSRLSPGGRISVVEIVVDGFVLHAMPSKMIHALTSSRLLAPLMRGLGSNAAGAGVCFQTEDQWTATFAQAGLAVAERRLWGPWYATSCKRILLHLRSSQDGSFWLARA